MVIRTDKFKECCSKILAATDANELATLTETLELKTVGKTLYLNVTNKEYYVSVKFEMDHEEEFHATVNANLFLKLVNQLTTETLTLVANDTYVAINANGNYKIPLIFENGDLMELPEIVINNPTVTMNIDSDILVSMLTYNSKELLKGTFAKPVQRLFYVDQEGCITFTSGACVNSFKLEKPISVLFNNRLVKLFRLFKGGDVVFTLGYDALSEEIIQTKVSFETDDIKLTALLSCDDSLLKSVPVDAIRGRASYMYEYQVDISKDLLLQTINRLLLFVSLANSKELLKPYSKFQFKSDEVVIWDCKGENFESVNYVKGNLEVDEPVEIVLDIQDLKSTLETCTESYVTLKFGDAPGIVLTRGNIANVIPKVSGIN